MYFFSESVTILVHITLHRGLATEDNDEGDLIKHSHYYISDDKDHDSLFVQHCMMLHWEWIGRMGFKPREHWVFSDGCAAQFKGAKWMYFVARYLGLTNGCLMRWNFFGSGHGKGAFLTIMILSTYIHFLLIFSYLDIICICLNNCIHPELECILKSSIISDCPLLYAMVHYTEVLV